jgi:hypothetical protein
MTDAQSNDPQGDRFIFWQTWLVCTSSLFALFGVAMAIFGNRGIFKLYNGALATLFFNKDHFPSDVETFRAFIYAPLGGTIACSYILLTYIAIYPFEQKERWARNAILFGFGVWIVLDSAASIYYGAYFQSYLINGSSFLVKALPLIFTWKDFRKRKS